MYAPITSCDEEHSFSSYNPVLRLNRHRFNFENVKEYMVCDCSNLN
jgi:hypothetical protein